jgi:hypothetical protein
LLGITDKDELSIARLNLSTSHARSAVETMEASSTTIRVPGRSGSGKESR